MIAPVQDTICSMLTESPSMQISAVERETGIPKDTLRVWERRYGFPAPLRLESGERCYPDAQVRKLHVIRRLIDRGLRPSKLLHRSIEELTLTLQAAGSPARDESMLPGELRQIVSAVQCNDSEALRSQLKHALLRVGLRQFLSEIVDPLNVAIGESWARGQLSISAEHLYTEHVQNVLRQAIETVPVGTGNPRVLLTTLPGELHQLGLLMAHAYLALEGAQCISLGLQTPLGDVQSAASAHSADIVGLSFGQPTKMREARASLLALRGTLPPSIQIWAGGRFWQHSPEELPGMSLISALTDIPLAVATWRAQRSEAGSARI